MWPQKLKWLNSCSRYDARVPFILEKNLNNINVQTKSAHFGNRIIYTKTEEISFTWPSSHCLIECSLICCLHTWWAASSQLAVVRVGPRETWGGSPEEGVRGGPRGSGGGRSIKTTCYCGETSDHMVRRSWSLFDWACAFRDWQHLEQLHSMNINIWTFPHGAECRVSEKVRNILERFQVLRFTCLLWVQAPLWLKELQFAECRVFPVQHQRPGQGLNTGISSKKNIFFFQPLDWAIREKHV